MMVEYRSGAYFKVREHRNVGQRSECAKYGGLSYEQPVVLPQEVHT